ncbi:MAG: hypothetical protein HYY04_09550 [Chloroflexi bacterium]|nr:hypothetical protein [Chloroflexota bacterium]
MAVRVTDHGERDAAGWDGWSTVLPAIFILLIIFLSPLLYDLAGRFPSIP